MIHPDTIIDILGESEGIKVKDIPHKFKTYQSIGVKDIIWEPYGIENPSFAATLTQSSSLMSLQMTAATDYVWYEVYFKEIDKFVIVTADELLPCAFEAHKVGLSTLADNHGMVVIPTSVSEIRKIQERRMRATIPTTVAGYPGNTTGYYKPLIRRAHSVESQTAYWLNTSAGVYCSNGIMLMGIDPRNIQWWITNRNIHALEV